MITWYEHAEFCEDTHKMLYKGVDIGITAEMIQDLNAQTGMTIDDSIIESMYNSTLSVIRNKRIDEILS